jgi:subtilase family serine protease
VAQDAAVLQGSAAQHAIIEKHLQAGAQIQQFGDGVVITPASSISHPEQAGVTMHTNTKIFFPINVPGPHNANEPAVNAPPFSGYGFETPSSLSCVYQLVARANGCNPNTFHTNTTGGSKALAIVDAFHAPNSRADLVKYSTQFGLPAITAANYVVWYCGSTLASCNQTTPPQYNAGWEGEISLDVQMAHAIAPHAKLFLVEAASNSNTDLFIAVRKASALVAAAGGGQVSMSWGGGESSGETANDAAMATAKVTYFASTGDAPGTNYPSVSTKVVAVGGTSVSRNPVTLSLIEESAWYDAGGGPSQFIARPAFQASVASVVGTKRGVPDVSAVANPRTGVWVYISGQGGWNVFGGTSVASPVFAAIVNNSGHFLASSTAEHNLIYSKLGTAAYHDVTQGICGPYTGYWAKAGYDFCGAVGSPRGKTGQ